MELMTRVQILDKAVYVSLYANVLGKGIYLFLNSNQLYSAYSMVEELGKYIQVISSWNVITIIKYRWATISK